MAKEKGILLGDGLDIRINPIRGNDGKILTGVVIGNSVYQQQSLLLIANKGEFKELPKVGVGLNNYILDDNGYDDLNQEVASQFRADGMRIFSIEINNGKIQIDARYEDGNGFR